MAAAAAVATAWREMIIYYIASPFWMAVIEASNAGAKINERTSARLNPRDVDS